MTAARSEMRTAALERTVATADRDEPHVAQRHVRQVDRHVDNLAHVQPADPFKIIQLTREGT